jgi:hypothetical protein
VIKKKNTHEPSPNKHKSFEMVKRRRASAASAPQEEEAPTTFANAAKRQRRAALGTLDGNAPLVAVASNTSGAKPAVDAPPGTRGDRKRRRGECSPTPFAAHVSPFIIHRECVVRDAQRRNTCPLHSSTHCSFFGASVRVRVLFVFLASASSHTLGSSPTKSSI